MNVGIGARRTERVPMPEWGGDVIVSEMSGMERDAWEKHVLRFKGTQGTITLDNYRATLVVKCLVDEDGKRLFKDADAVKLGGLPASALSKLFNVAARLNGISKEDQQELVETFQDEQLAEDDA